MLEKFNTFFFFVIFNIKIFLFYMISVIIPTYNGASTIYRAIDSVTSQTYNDWQVVVVDDCSTDNTINIVEQEFKNYYGDKIKIIKNEENKGVGISRKIGVDNADGEFLIFLDADDKLTRDCLEKSLMIQQIQDADVVYSGTLIYIDSENQQVVNTDDFIMEGKISPILHTRYPKKWLTGKMFRTELMKKVPMSPKRIAEDVNTLFYACYMAKKVRSTKYCGYIHIYTPNSLIGFETEENIFYLYCESTKVDIELIEFILEHKDIDVLKELIKGPKVNFEIHKKMVDSGQIKHKYVEENYLEWQYICDFFGSLDDKVKALELELKEDKK